MKVGCTRYSIEREDRYGAHRGPGPACSCEVHGPVDVRQGSSGLTRSCVMSTSPGRSPWAPRQSRIHRQRVLAPFRRKRQEVALRSAASQRDIAVRQHVSPFGELVQTVLNRRLDRFAVGGEPALQRLVVDKGAAFELTTPRFRRSGASRLALRCPSRRASGQAARPVGRQHAAPCPAHAQRSKDRAFRLACAIRPAVTAASILSPGCFPDTAAESTTFIS